METLRDRLAELADDAPTGGAPPTELWARGKRAQRLRTTALAVTVLVAGAVGTGIGVRFADGGGQTDLAPVTTFGFALPIDYPASEELPSLGTTPGPLAAVWLAPREPYTPYDNDPGLAPEAVGLVAETGAFGTLPIDLSPWAYESPDAPFALSPDGRRIAYYPPVEGDGAGSWPSLELVVRDLVSGEEFKPAFDFEIRAGASWVDNARLVGHVAEGSDADGWLWAPGTEPKLVNPHLYLDPQEPPVMVFGGDPPWACQSPTMFDGKSRREPSVLCDILGVVGSKTLLGHLASSEANALDREVIAVDISNRDDFPFDDPALRRVVVNPGAPYPVAFATDLIAGALEADGGAS